MKIDAFSDAAFEIGLAKDREALLPGLEQESAVLVLRTVKLLRGVNCGAYFQPVFPPSGLVIQ